MFDESFNVVSVIITLPNTEKIDNVKNQCLFSLLKKTATFILQSLELWNSCSFNLQNLGKYFKCQNIHVACYLVYKHQKSKKFIKIA